MGNRLFALVAAPVVSVMLLAGCGSESTDPEASDPTKKSDSPSATESASPSATAALAPAGTPGCATVWQMGETLAEDYAGCALDGALVAADELDCSSGQVIVKYADRFWAVRGGEIAESKGPLLDDPSYGKDLASCRG